MALVRVGRIDRAHGVDGDVRVVGESAAFVELFERSYWFVGFDASSVLHVRVEALRTLKSDYPGSVLARLSCARSRTHAERLRGASVFLPSSELGESVRDRGEATIQGFRILDPHGNDLGTVKDHLAMPAQDLIVMVQLDGKEVLIPDTPAIVKKVDPVAREVIVELVDGLLDV